MEGNPVHYEWCRLAHRVCGVAVCGGCARWLYWVKDPLFLRLVRFFVSVDTGALAAHEFIEGAHGFATDTHESLAVVAMSCDLSHGSLVTFAVERGRSSGVGFVHTKVFENVSFPCGERSLTYRGRSVPRLHR